MAAADDTLTSVGTGYWCDGNNTGSCTTLFPGGQGVHQGEFVGPGPGGEMGVRRHRRLPGERRDACSNYHKDWGWTFA
jgi:hypothetical protein